MSQHCMQHKLKQDPAGGLAKSMLDSCIYASSTATSTHILFFWPECLTCTDKLTAQRQSTRVFAAGNAEGGDFGQIAPNGEGHIAAVRTTPCKFKGLPDITQHFFAPLAVTHTQQTLIVVLVVPVSKQQIEFDHLYQLIVAVGMLWCKV